MTTVEVLTGNYKHAFQCGNCPKRGDEQGCPYWWEIIQTNKANGEEKITKGCGTVLMQKFLIETMMAANRPAAAFEGLRNQIVSGFDRIGKLMSPQQVAKAILDTPIEIPPLLSLINKGKDNGDL